MEFCIITPTAYLEQYATLSKRQFVLAQVAEQDSAYLNFYRHRADLGDFIILDNGAYEGEALEPRRYMEIIRELQPDVAVLPDLVMGNWLENCSLALRFLDQWEELGRRNGALYTVEGLEWMFVPQVQSNKESDYISRNAWLESVQRVALDARAGHLVKWIGFGRYLHTEFINMPGHTLRRVGLAKEIRHHTLFSHLKFHALGMGDGDIDELTSIRASGLFESCDSSAPVWRGLHNWSFSAQDRKGWQQFGKPVEFTFDPSYVIAPDAADEKVKSNLRLCGVEVPTDDK